MKRSFFVVALCITSLAMLGCGLTHFAIRPTATPTASPTPLPTLTFTPTFTSVPTHTPTTAPTATPAPTQTATPVPGLGLSSKVYQDSFSKLTFVFKQTDSGLQGSTDKGVIASLDLVGSQENLSKVTLYVMLAADENLKSKIIDAFFNTSFPDDTGNKQIKDWLANSSGITSGTAKAETTVGKVHFSYAVDGLGMGGFMLILTPAE
jgi:hypothetical protein